MTSMSGEKLKNFEYERIIFGENNMLWYEDKVNLKTILNSECFIARTSELN
jgi:hypothetical protein